ncbi:MAG: phosphohistidine phosphatase SixA [Acidobacteriota bacterium]|nr:phosphohistidine phosphatase SixA [Acidobacteriota bacterium]
MRLYIVRHAIADPHGTPGVNEEDRALTAEGIRKMRLGAEGLRRLDYVPDLIFSSPLIRARQTAEILLAAFGKEVRMEILPSLAPSGSRRDLYQAMHSCRKDLRGLMLVGHQPSLGEIAAEIIGGSPESHIELKKGGVCAIELMPQKSPPRGSMIALLTPSILRRIAAQEALDL